jgi:hypothetical protein
MSQKARDDAQVTKNFPIFREKLVEWAAQP